MSDNHVPSATRATQVNPQAQPINPQAQPSLKQLVARTISDGKRLLTAQVNLTTTEIAQTGKTIGTISVFVLIALTFISLGAIFILVAIAYGIVAAGLPVWAGFLIVAVALIVIGLIFGAVARNKGQHVNGLSVAEKEWKQTADTLSQLNERKPF